MKIQLLRNATMIIEYNGNRFLTDPMLSDKGEIRSFAGISKNPTINLKTDKNDILKNIDAVIVSHNHPDHFDEAASNFIQKDKIIFCQPCDEDELKNQGFINTISIQDSVDYKGVNLIRTTGFHGKGKVLDLMGEVSGFIFKSENEPTLYWVGDSIFCDEVKKNIEKYNPDLIITHSGGAKLPDSDPIIMDDFDTIETIRNSNAKVIAVHMESLDHCFVTRDQLKKKIKEEGLDESRLIVPEDNEIFDF